MELTFELDVWRPLGFQLKIVSARPGLVEATLVLRPAASESLIPGHLGCRQC